MTRSKTSPNGPHGAPTPNNQPMEEGAPTTAESDRISSKAKLIAELVTERKRVYTLNQELVKKIHADSASSSKFQSTINARDRSISNLQIEIAEQKAVVETFKAKIGAKDVSQKAKLLQLGSEHDAAVSILNNQLESKTKDVKADRAKAISVGREHATTNDRLKKLLADVGKQRSDYDELTSQHRDSKSEASRLRKELTTTRKKVGEQLELTLAHKERMKDKEIERERIRFDKAKDNNYTKLLAEERKHLNIQERVDRRYDKADTANEKKHIRKTTTDRENVGTAVARAAQAAMNVQMASNDGHFPNPRGGVDLQRVSCVCCFVFLLL
jgi:hypothetical protein